ncbi:MAG: GIY-YIG nuclease family protein [Candidatus Marinimicrobia bacterium]|nr:GIY-YIG nuclease family protein [Candidatus Neomarinimicrobiota bacterium]
MTNRSKTLYIGITSDLENRVFEHKNKLKPGFTHRYNINRLVYYEEFDNPQDAISREKELKGWLRKKKIALIESLNPKREELNLY